MATDKKIVLRVSLIFIPIIILLLSLYFIAIGRINKNMSLEMGGVVGILISIFLLVGSYLIH